MIYPINHLPDRITVGVQTEQGVEDIGFDLRPWLAVFPDMVFTVWATRPGEQEAYPVNEQMLIGSVLYWHPDGFDTEMHGTGKVEVVGVGENQRKLSGYVETSVRATSMSATKEPGENTAPWYEKIINAAMEIAADVDVGAGGLFLVDLKADGGHRYLADRTQAEIIAAVNAGKTCILHDTTNELYLYGGMEEEPTTREQCPTFYGEIVVSEKNGTAQRKCYVRADGYVSSSGVFVKTPSPYKLTIGGIDYDGSNAVSVDLPDGADNVFVVTVQWDYSVSGYVADCTPDEVLQAAQAGKACFAHRPASRQTLPLTGFVDGKPTFEVVYWNQLHGWSRDSVAINDDKTAETGMALVRANPETPIFNTKSVQYLRWDGSKWFPATIAQLKADLGLT